MTKNNENVGKGIKSKMRCWDVVRVDDDVVRTSHHVVLVFWWSSNVNDSNRNNSFSHQNFLLFFSPSSLLLIKGCCCDWNVYNFFLLCFVSCSLYRTKKAISSASEFPFSIKKNTLLKCKILVLTRPLLYLYSPSSMVLPCPKLVVHLTCHHRRTEKQSAIVK